VDGRGEKKLSVFGSMVMERGVDDRAIEGYLTARRKRGLYPAIRVSKEQRRCGVRRKVSISLSARTKGGAIEGGGILLGAVNNKRDIRQKKRKRGRTSLRQKTAGKPGEMHTVKKDGFRVREGTKGEKGALGEERKKAQFSINRPGKENGEGGDMTGDRTQRAFEKFRKIRGLV